MPPNSLMLLTGNLPLDAYSYGGIMIVTGVISTEPQEPTYGDDTLLITIDAISYEYIVTGTLPILAEPVDPGGVDDGDCRTCDGCKFAIIVAGDGRSGHKPTYWENALNLRNHKVDAEDYCPGEENIYVLYANGIAPDTGAIPGEEVRLCSEYNLQWAHERIARAIAECRRQGKRSTVQKMFTNHGSDDAGVFMRPGQWVSPAELTAQQQMLIDSCCRTLYDEFITCYGGDMADGLQNLDNLNKTQIHVNTAAGATSPGYSPHRGGHVFLNAKINCRQNGGRYEDCVRQAKQEYIDYLVNLFDSWDNHLTAMEDTLSDMPSGPERDRLTDDIAERVEQLDTLLNAIAEAAQSWMRHTFNRGHCEWKHFSGMPGQRVTFDYQGNWSCGNSEIVAEEQGTGRWRRLRTWNWNIPYSRGYREGNEHREVTIPEWSTGSIYIHSSASPFTVTAGSRPGSSKADSPSNPEEFAGFSCGGRDSSSWEFGDIIAANSSSYGTGDDGFYFDEVPRRLGSGGVDVYSAHFTAPAGNEYWDDMEINFKVLSVAFTGNLSVQFDQADSSSVTVMVNDTGEYVIPVGAVQAPVDGIITFGTSSGVAFEWDCWSLRSRVPTWAGCCVPPMRGDVDGDGAVLIDISDLVYLVDYMFTGGPVADCFEEADVDASGGILDIADLVYLVDYMFTGGPAPLPCP